MNYDCLQSILPCAKLFSSHNLCTYVRVCEVNIITSINKNVENESFDGL